MIWYDFCPFHKFPLDENSFFHAVKILTIFDDMIADIVINKKINAVVTELFIRGRKWNISVVFITQSYFKVPKDVRQNSKIFSIIKISNKQEIQQIALNHSSDIDLKTL